MKVIDISKYQNKIDWDRVKADGVQGVIIRAGFGAGNIDNMFYKHIADAIAYGMNIGIYWFSYAYNVKMAKQEAIYCHAAIERYREKINLPVFFDWEYDSFDFAKRFGIMPNKQLITDMNFEFCRMIEAIGYKAGYYLNMDYAINYVDESRLKNYKRWYARYTVEQQTDCYLWQFTSKAKIDGINGNVDCNVLYPESDEKTKEPQKEDNNETDQKEEAELYDMKTIKRGSRGKAVKIWQVILGVKVDGVFGKDTEEKTLSFQKKNGLTQDGVVGKLTWKAGLESV